MCDPSTQPDLLGAYNLPMFGPPCESVCDQIEVSAEIDGLPTAEAVKVAEDAHKA